VDSRELVIALTGFGETISMGGTEILKNIGQTLSAEARVKNVFGEPVISGERTIIPVASVCHAFAGGGGGTAEGTTADGGGAGYLSAVPAGVIEISPEGTRYIPISSLNYKVALIAVGVGIGLFLGFRKR
jgi:uncharacterized spore protein YtfJ